MSSPEPGDMVLVAPKEQLTGYLIMPALYVGKEWKKTDNSEAYEVYIVLFKGNVVEVATRSHTVEVLDKKWPSHLYEKKIGNPE